MAISEDVIKYQTEKAIVTQHEQMRLMSSDYQIVIWMSMYCTKVKNHFDTKIILISFSIPKIWENKIYMLEFQEFKNHCFKQLRGYCTPGPYFWRICAFSQKIKQLRTKGDTAAVSGSWKLPLPAPATTVAKNQCLTCCLTCCFWCWISHWVLLILSWNMWLRGRSGGLWLGRDPGGVGGSVKIGDWVFDLVGVFPWLRSFGLTFRLLVLREYSYLGVFLSAVTIWSMPFVLVSCC